MKNALTNSFWIALAFCLLVSCNTSEKKASENATMADTLATFVPLPKKIPKPGQEPVPLEPGATAPDFLLPAVDGKYYSLASFEAAKVLVVVFTCNHCPTAQAYEDRIIQITKDYEKKGVQIVAISPNSPPALLLEECGFTDLGDTYEEMIVRANDKQFPFPYLYDGDDHSVSLKYGPVATPHAFVFDEGRILRYVGRIDGNEKPGTGNGEDLRDAIDAVLKNEQVAVAQTKTFGCSVKWGWKTAFTEKVNKEWTEKTVTVAPIDEKGIRTLLANDTDKLRLINVWATWCGPCVIEFPEFVEIHRMYMGRDFEFVSISADKPENMDKVEKFLQKHHSALSNYIFSKEDQYALIEAIDPNWNGSLPYTLLVAPGGEKIYARQGVISPHELKQTIVDHPMIGRYY